MLLEQAILCLRFSTIDKGGHSAKMSYLICVDAGHGGIDNGASYQGRLEKDDNLRLALEVERQLLTLGQRVVMTRTQDVAVSLAERVAIANGAGADLFISLHRDSYIEQTPWTNGVTNYIQDTAPESYEFYAEVVLEAVVNVGVQSNRGVRRGNYYVIRNTNMPGMLLEMGYIINEIDNALFDEHLYAYAAAIARAIVYALDNSPSSMPPGGDPLIVQAQRWLNQAYGAGLTVDGRYGPNTKRAIVRALQIELNSQYGAGLGVDGIFGPATKAAIPLIAQGDSGSIVRLLQAALQGNGFSPVRIDGVFGPNTHIAVMNFQRYRQIRADGIAGPTTFEYLLS